MQFKRLHCNCRSHLMQRQDKPKCPAGQAQLPHVQAAQLAQTCHAEAQPCSSTAACAQRKQQHTHRYMCHLPLLARWALYPPTSCPEGAAPWLLASVTAAGAGLPVTAAAGAAPNRSMHPLPPKLREFHWRSARK